METLTADEARKLYRCLQVCEYTLADDYVRDKTNAKKVYSKVWETICLHTNGFMLKTVYSVPGVMPPID